jgi:hypothetical protein
MINIFRPYTYRDVARELAEGLASGDVVLEEDDSSEDLAAFAYFALNFVHPVRLSYAAGAAAASAAFGMEMAKKPETKTMRVELSPEQFDSLPKKVKDRLLDQLKELHARGVELEVTDAKGRPFPDGHVLAFVVPKNRRDGESAGLF